MVKRLRIRNITIKWVLRHRWEENKGLTNYEVWSMRKRFKLGMWFERQQVVGPVQKGKDKDERVKNTFNNDNLVNEYMLGFDLVVCKTWFTIKFKPTLGLKY